MRRIVIEKVEEGMILGKALLKSDGKILLGQGCKLSARIISRLSEWGFESIVVEGDPQSADEIIESAGINNQNMSMDEIFVQIDNMFSKVDDDEIMMKLKNGLKFHISRKYTANDTEREERV